jgi:hypothetical protein
MSTGPRTPEGLQRLILCRLVHGRRSKWFRAALREAGVVATGIEAELVAQELRVRGQNAAEETSPEKVAEAATLGSSADEGLPRPS